MGKSRMIKWRLIQSGHQDAYTNMAIDEAMFILTAAGDILPTLRLYGWDPPAISIGYFQEMPVTPSDNKTIQSLTGQKKETGVLENKHAAANKKNIDVVRRLTGGGAILHDKELTYCLVAGLKDSVIPENIPDSYGFISEAVISGLRSLGVYAQMRGSQTGAGKKKISGKTSPGTKEPFFCFDRSSKYDIIYNNKKISGSAQRRKDGVLLHHGSILLDKENPGTSISINSVLGREIGFEELAQNVIDSFEKKLSVNFMPGELTPDEKKLTRELIKTKFLKNIDY